MRVLVACEFSGVVRRAFREAGHDAWSCDLILSEDDSEHHIIDDVMNVIDWGWDLMIAHPPCTYLANSGVRWMYVRNDKGERVPNKERFTHMLEAVDFFNALLAAPIDRIAVENPIQHGMASSRLIAQPAQTIQPWMFGHGETKATRLWLKNLPPLMATKVVAGREDRIWKLSPSPDRWKERSRTFEGIAQAMAAQWGPLGPLTET